MSWFKKVLSFEREHWIQFTLPQSSHVCVCQGGAAWAGEKIACSTYHEKLLLMLMQKKKIITSDTHHFKRVLPVKMISDQEVSTHPGSVNETSLWRNSKINWKINFSFQICSNKTYELKNLKFFHLKKNINHVEHNIPAT